MKLFIVLLFFFMSAASAFAQCNNPLIESWYFSTPSNVNVEFVAPENAQVYELKVYALYTGTVPGTANTTFTGSAIPGANSVSVNPTVILDFTVLQHRYFYKAELRVECGDDEWSDYTTFYMSPYSMLNNPGISCEGVQFMPLEIVPDNSFEALEYQFEVAVGEGPDEIGEIGVLVDIGHMFNGDLSISLISPSGTEVFLLDYPNELANSTGLSMYFADGGQPQVFENQYGIFEPAGSLSAFAGESSAGTWTLSVIDNSLFDYGFLFGVCLNFGSPPCTSSISGLTYYDLNGNNLKDVAEPIFPYAHLYDTENDVDFYSDINGQYYHCFSEGSNVIELISPIDYYTVSPQSASPNVPLGGFRQNLNFALIPEPGFKDLQVKLWQVEPVIAGSIVDFIVDYKNIGTSCISDANFTVNLAEGLSINSIDQDNVTIINATTAEVFISTDICPYEVASFSISCDANTNLALCTALKSQISVSQLPPNELNEPLEDNTFVLESEVKNEIILNFKSVSHDTITSWFMSSNQYLDYQIHFQNLGIENLENLVVEDQMSTMIDLSTFHIEGVSHMMNIEQDGSLLRFVFNDINLPSASANEILSRGYVRFSVKPIVNFAPGDIIENSATVFFDSDSELDLNTVTTTLIETSGLEEIAIDAKLFPNPATDHLQIFWPETVMVSFIEVYGIDGKLIDSFPIGSSSTVNIDVATYTSGVYLLRFGSSQMINPLLWMKE